MKKRKLTDFLPLYSNARTGQIVIDEKIPPAMMDKPAGDDAPQGKPSRKIMRKLDILDVWAVIFWLILIGLVIMLA